MHICGAMICNLHRQGQNLQYGFKMKSWTGKYVGAVIRAVTRTLIGGGVYSYIQVLPD